MNRNLIWIGGSLAVILMLFGLHYTGAHANSAPAFDTNAPYANGFAPAPVAPPAPVRTVTTTRYVSTNVVRHRRHRSTKKSVAIVAGSAGAGAAIGALAGGGKGAGIGALAGGGAGFVYDRLTRNKQ